MDFKIGEVYLTKEEFDDYINKTIDSIFNVLYVYEKCESTDNFETYFAYVNRLTSEMSGLYYILGVNPFVSVSAILMDMSKNLYDHAKTKALTFHCISVIKKAMVM